MSPDSSTSASNIFPPTSVWVLVLGLGLTTAVFRWAWQDASSNDLRRFKASVENWRQEFETRAEKYELGLGILADWLSQSETPSKREWENRMERMGVRVNYPGMLLLTYSPWFSRGTKNQTLWKDHYPAHWPPPEAWTDYLLPVWYQEVHPPARAYPWGASRREDLLQDISIDGSGWHELDYIFNYKGVGSTRRHMVPTANSTNAMAGFHFYIIAQRNDLPRAVAFDEPPLSEEERNGYPVDRGAQKHHAALGVLIGTICVDPFLNSIFGGRELDIDLDLYAGDVNETNRLTRLDQPAIRRARNSLYEDLEIPWYHKRWHIVAVPKPSFYKNSHLMRAWAMGGSGLILTLSLFGLLRIQEGARRKVEAWAFSLEAAREELRGVHKSRIRLERDLHDGVLQSIYASVLGIRRAERLLHRQPDRVGPLLHDIAGEMDAAMSDIRRHLTSRGSEGISSEQLPEVLAGIANAYNRAGHSGVQVDIDPEALQRLTRDQSEQLFQCVREAVSNAHKHGNAPRIGVSLRAGKQTVTVSISDNGKGFDPGTVDENGRGLSHMSQRAELCGGTFKVASQPGGPTQILISIPIRRAAHEPA